MSDAELELRPRRVDIQDVAATGPTTRTHMRSSAPPAIWSVIAAFMLCMVGSAGAADRPPNIVLLLADDLGEQKNLAGTRRDKLAELEPVWSRQ